jgi:hypothetical protein
MQHDVEETEWLSGTFNFPTFHYAYSSHYDNDEGSNLSWSAWSVHSKYEHKLAREARIWYDFRITVVYSQMAGSTSIRFNTWLSLIIVIIPNLILEFTAAGSLRWAGRDYLHVF